MANSKVPAYAKQLQKHLDKIKTECQGISNLAAINDIGPEYVDAAETALKKLVSSVAKDLKTKKEQVDVTLPGLGDSSSSESKKHDTPKASSASSSDTGDGKDEKEESASNGFKSSLSSELE